MFVLLLFFCSGATALVYEVLWSKYLTLMLGSTVQAQTIVLAVYMGGLALGNWIFGKRSTRLADPLTLYGVLEMVIALYGFFFPTLYRAGDALFVTLGTPVSRISILVLSLKLFLSVLLLLLPTILMGGTLPLLAAWIERQRSLDAGVRVGIFYAVNSLGAVVGAGLAGFFLVQNYGMVFSLELAGFVNFVVGITAAALGKRERLRIARPETAPAASVAPEKAPAGGEADGEPAATLKDYGVLVALTGGISMGLEVLASRALALIVGGSLQAFAIVLMSFILGIGLGSVVISSFRAVNKHAFAAIFSLLLIAGMIVALNVLFIEHWTVGYAQAKYGLAANHTGYVWHEVAVALVSFFILGLPAACLGAVLPLAIRLARREDISLGDEVGRLLAWNTSGAVAGVLLTGFIIMPVLGLHGAFGLSGVALMALAGFIAFKRDSNRAFIAAVALCVAASTAILNSDKGWQTVIGAGLYRVRNQYLTLAAVRKDRVPSDILFYKDSADATVSVEREKSINGDSTQRLLRINGKPDASTQGDLATQYLLAHLPMMANPDAKQVFVLGFGSGITAGALLGHPIEQLTIAENCDPVLDAAPLFNQWNRGVLTNARTRIRDDDARSVLKLSPAKYDVIITEPSNPWVVGVGNVFSKEFYELCASRLSDGGIIAQWFHTYEMSDEIVMMVIRTFSSVFPHMELWDPQQGDLILLGSAKPWDSSPARWQKVFDRPEPRKDLEALGIRSAVVLWARQSASQRTAFAIPGDGPTESDEAPILEYQAPEAFFVADYAQKLVFFDERSIQFPLASPIKIATLRALPDQPLLESFTRFKSGNPDITIYLNAIAQRASGGVERLDPMGEIIFRPAASYPENPPMATNATPEFAVCLRAEASMLRDDAHWKEGAEKISKVLLNLIAARNLKPRDFAPTYYAALITRFAIGHGDYQMALDSLRLGFAFSGNDEQLLFLSRALDRIFPASAIKNLGANQIPPK